jgi:Cu2+-exporting ATPase
MARRGVLVVKPDGIQALADCTHVLFDKTGTLTEASLSRTDLRTFDGVSHDGALRLATALARQSRHPVARAIAAAYPDIDAAAVHDVATHAGAGVSATIDGRTLRLGRSDFALAGKRRASSGCRAAGRRPRADRRLSHHGATAAGSAPRSPLQARA